MCDRPSSAYRIEEDCPGTGATLKMCERLDPSPVLALIQEKPGLLPAHHVRLEAQSGFEKNRTTFQPAPKQKLPVFNGKIFPRRFLNVPAQS